MRAHVVIQSGRAGERSQTVATLEGFLADVNDSVHAQFFRLRKRFLAMATPVRFTGHARAEMIVKEGSLSESHLALAAFEIVAFAFIFKHFVVNPSVTGTFLDSRNRLCGVDFLLHPDCLDRLLYLWKQRFVIKTPTRFLR